MTFQLTTSDASNFWPHHRTQTSHSLNCETIRYTSFYVGLNTIHSVYPSKNRAPSMLCHPYNIVRRTWLLSVGSHGHGVHRQQRRSPWIENSRPLDVRSQRIRGFVRIVRYGLSFMVFQCHNSESTYWAGDTLLHVHIHLSQISAQKSKEGTTHARKTSKLFVDTFQQLPPFKSALQLTCNPCWKRIRYKLKRNTRSLWKKPLRVLEVQERNHMSSY